jgi:hypothetical protein
MITVPELAAEALGSFLADHMARRVSSTDVGLAEVIASLRGLHSTASATAMRSITMSNTLC